ncbi:MAG: leucine-rich repeat domain-containing protein [Ruminococcus sp.]
MGFKIENSKLIKYTEETGVTSANIPECVTSIENYAFLNCSKLTSIAIPDSVVSIEKGAFQRCSKLETITIPNSVTSIKEFAFSSCSNLKSITIPDSVTSIGEYIFSNCTSLESVKFSENVTTIRKYTFSNCKILESLTIPNSVTSIKEFAFASCTNLKSVSIPETLTDISKDAFNWCSPDLKIIKRKINPEKTESEPVDYKELFIKAFYAKELSNKENIFKQVNDESIKIPFAVFLFTEFESKTACDYITENSQKVLHYLVDENKIEVMSKIIPILNQK